MSRLQISLLACALLAIAALPPIVHGADLDAYNLTVNDTNPDPGDLVTVRWTAISRGDKFVGSSQQGVMLSTDSTIRRSGSGETLLGKEGLGPLGGVALPETSRETKVVRIPDWVVPGTSYYIGVWADYDRERSESDENNNASNAVKITIRSQTPDLYISDLSSNDYTPDPGDLITLNWTAHTRNDIYVGSSTQAVMLSRDNRTTERSDEKLGEENLGALGGNLLLASVTQFKTVKLPDNLTPGATYYVGIISDYNSERAETDEDNNFSATVPITIRGPDLKAVGLEVGGTALADKTDKITAWPGRTLHLGWDARNDGNRSTELLDFSQQAIRWSDDTTIDRDDEILDREPLGILLPNTKSLELKSVKVPDDAVIGQTYYIAIEADTDREFHELDEDNNFSGRIEIKIGLPVTATTLNLSDFNHLPDLEGEGLEINDPRLQDSDGDGKEDFGATMNPSRTFAPGDRAYGHLRVKYDSDYTTLFNGSEPTQLELYWNTTPHEDGMRKIGETELNVGSDVYNNTVDPFGFSTEGRRLNVRWNVPETQGRYYVLGIVKVHIDDKWYELKREWLDGGNVEDPVTVTDARPVILVHGWSDKGNTFENLEIMIETIWRRPVRFFGYETSKVNNAPRVDQAYTDLSNETKQSLALQLKDWLASPEGNGKALTDFDIIAHSMGGLVARNYLLIEPEKTRRLLTLGTPSYGGLFADDTGIILNNQAEDLEYGSKVTWKLHREWAARRAELPPTLTIIGTDDPFGTGQYNQSDKVVTVSSASLESLGYPAYYVPMQHSGEVSMVSIYDTAHPSWGPIEDFINGEHPTVSAQLPGRAGGADDVGHKNHPEAQRYGALYILKATGDSIEPVTVTVDGHSGGLFGLTRSRLSRDGVYFYNINKADAASTGSEFEQSGDYTVSVGGETLTLEDVLIKAGETTVYNIRDNSQGLVGEDLDFDLIPDALEAQIAAMHPDDEYFDRFDVLPSSDFDGDGIAELLELAIGSNPLIHEADAIEMVFEDGRLRIRHTVASESNGLTVIGQQGDALDSWTHLGIRSEILPDGRREWSIPVAQARAFLRLKVEPSKTSQ